MQKVFKKLKSESGVSILFALMFLLVLTIIAAVIMTASSVNLDKTTGRRDGQKEYFAISSAAKLVQKTFANTEAAGYESKTMFGCTLDSNLAGEILTPPKEADINEVCPKLTAAGEDAKLKSYLLKAAYDLYISRPKQYVSEESEPQYVEAPGKTAKPLTFQIKGQDIEEVTAAVTFDRDYNITIALTVPDSLFSMTLKFSASTVLPDKNSPVEEEGPICSHTYSKLVQQPNGVYQMKTFKVTCTGVKKTLNTKITWDGGTIIKGVVKSGT